MPFQSQNQATIARQDFTFTNDRCIRLALKEKLENQYHTDPDARVVEELGVTHGAARIDIAVVNGEIHGYELKSDRDTLNRLPSQIKIYNSVFDQVTLVVGKNHLHEAIKIVPDWWGITIAKIMSSSDEVSFCTIRDPEQNPDQDPTAIAALLWKEEALSILEKLGQANGVRWKARKYIYIRLAEVLTKKALSIVVRDQLRARLNWRSDLQCMLDDD